MHAGRGPGLTSRRLGETTGTETVPLNETQIANHNHTVTADANAGGFGGGGADSPDPSGHYLASTSASGQFYADGNTNVVPMAATSNTGGSQSHNNVQPFLAMNFIIALQGVYPSRS